MERLHLAAGQQFEVCEICGGFVKDRDSLHIHFFWAHKVEINKEVSVAQFAFVSYDNRLSKMPAYL